jgi:outer membrane receptor protein involved in Fe transport
VDARIQAIILGPLLAQLALSQAFAQTEPGSLPLAAAAPEPEPEPAQTSESPAKSPPESGPSYGASARVGSPQQATSSFDLVARRVRLTPHTSTGDLLNGVPGVLAVQHAGGGKANQYFLRGFDADHGSDIAFLVDDVPINVVSHAHGQGYSELQFIPPDAVKTIEVRKGPYFAEYGDQGTAGVIHFRLDDAPKEQHAYVQGGSFGTLRSAALVQPRIGAFAPVVAVDWFQNRGPYAVHENTRRFSSMGKFSHDLGDAGTLSLTVMSYASDWNAPGQIPLRAIRSGLIDRYGSIDSHEGGNARRDVASLRYAVEQGPQRLTWTSYVQRYELALYSNFGLYSADPERGDMVRQGDQRVIYGTRNRYTVTLSRGHVRSALSGGFQMRQDEARATLDHAPARISAEHLLRGSVRERALGVFAEADTRIYGMLRAVLGARADRMNFSVKNQLQAADSEDRESGEQHKAMLSPKASLILHTPIDLDVFTNAGSGFRSNDARGVVTHAGPRADPMTRAVGYELGLRQALFAERFAIAATAYQLDLSSEAVFVGDSGMVEQHGKTRRRGVELNVTARPLRWLYFDLDASYARAVFVANAGNGDAVALAPRWLGQGAVTAEHPSGVRARISGIFVGKRPATEDGGLTAKGFTRVDAGVEYTYRMWLVGVAAQNLLNAQYAQAQFASTTRLPGESQADMCPRGARATTDDGAFQGCEDLNIVSGYPLTVLATAGTRF